MYAMDSNRLLDSGGGGFAYDEHGNMTTMPHLPGPLSWDHADRLSKVELLGGGTGYYAYNSSGLRTRKVLHRNGGLVEERVYLGDFEVHRWTLNGNETFRRTTVHVMDDTRRIALIEHDTIQDSVRARYQLGNHLGSCCLEVDGSMATLIVSYEEYHPYGTTSLWLGANDVEVSDRRYRYTGKESDEETSLYYHGARYYVPWLGRWTAADPIRIKDGTNVYAYVRANPIRLHDPSGIENKPANETDRQIMMMTDAQLYRFLKGSSTADPEKAGEARHSFADAATGAFRQRAFAMIRRYKMEVQFTVPETVISSWKPQC
jgi:RHS repeat-associated protein